MYRASVGITTNMRVTATDWIAENAVELGIDGIWVGEDIDMGQDVYVLTTAALLNAQKARVGTGIIPITVHRIVTSARAAVTLQNTGKGRFVFGTGIGGIQDLKKLGIIVRKPVTELRKSVDTLKKLWAGETVTVKSELMNLDAFSLGLKKAIDIPIFLGVRGPKMLKLVGEVADGAVLSGPIDYLKDAVKRINKSAEEMGRKADEIEKVAWLPTIPTFKGGKESLAKRVVALVVADMPQQVIDILDVDKERVDKLRTAVAESGPDAGIPHVDQELIDMFSISGNKEHMVDRFELLAEIGLTEAVLGPPFSGDWRAAMTEIFSEIGNRKDT
jgi:alkanesulfonate monooxygenase SsuD/methylene tetrahydromethanopterin reductase-like flavin-dependent oxidoreductase (luciferase family)